MMIVLEEIMQLEELLEEEMENMRDWEISLRFSSYFEESDTVTFIAKAHTTNHPETEEKMLVRVRNYHLCHIPFDILKSSEWKYADSEMDWKSLI